MGSGQHHNHKCPQAKTGATFICPISHLKIDIANIFFVDNTDLMHMDMSNHSSDDNTVNEEMTGAIHNWGHLLLATGSTLKPKKCSYTLIGYKDKGGAVGPTMTTP